MEIVELKLSQLKPYDKNARKHEDYDISAIMASIQEFGFCDPIGVWGDENIIVEGHGRYQAAKRLKMKTVPCIRLDELTDEQRRAYALAHNKTAELSSWLDGTLFDELDNIFNIDMGKFGFEPLKKPDDEDAIEEAEIPEEVQARCKTGDIWQMGDNKLICGDSLDDTVISTLLDGNIANMVFTDPPYGYSYQSNMRTKSAKYDVLKNDDKILDFMPIIKKHNTGFVYICTAWKVFEEWAALFQQYFDLTNVIIWVKGGGGIGDLFHTFSTDYEMILVANNGNEIKGKRYGSVWSFQKSDIQKMKKEELLQIVLEQKKYQSVWEEKKDNPNEYLHPTQKPVRLSARAIISSTETGESVLDIFGGSGSTLLACEQLGRKCYMSELSEHYCDVIIQRWENFTGKKAVKIG